LLSIALLVLLASCGGDDSPKQADRTAGASAATGPAGQDGTSGRKGSNGSAAGPTPGAGGSAPANPPSAGENKTTARDKAKTPEGASPDGNPTMEELQKRVDKRKESLEKDKSGGGTNTGPAPPPAQPSTGPQEVLFRKAKRVCESMGLDALARKYGVAPKPEAVATAFAKSYPETFRRAVHDGCRSAFAG
jgi:hypothetical protein